MNSSGLVLPFASPMRFGNATGSENAPVPAFAIPLPSMTDPFQSTSTCRSNVAIAASEMSGGSRTLLAFTCRDAELHRGAEQPEDDPGEHHPALLGHRGD